MKNKKWMIALLVFATAISLCGCKSEAERKLEKATKQYEKSKRAAEEAQKEYFELKEDIERLRALESALGN